MNITYECSNLKFRYKFPCMMKKYFVLLPWALSLSTVHSEHGEHDTEVAHIFEQGLPDTCLKGPRHKVSISI